MAYLNAQEREDLLHQLKGMRFRGARWKLNRMDPKGRLAYYRNAQASGKLYTRYVLEGLGTQVTLVEQIAGGEDPQAGRAKFDFVEVMVEPTPDNRT